MNSLEIARMAAEFKSRPAAKPATPVSHDRVKIIAGSKIVGGKIAGRTISGLGKTWSGIVADHETSVYGLAPGQDHRVTLQYAYVI